ncbi:TrbG/VirB9 family P-type conjugative transfer protein [Paraburkholderia aromaticivorans]|uniref:TrbG/VirB9 family P-type conjugative transfer protein n=1 Tax=Paraburkholderia aromaticivorans TaxID=2026199 RepID=UPI0014561CC6|nr:TrbG/VirB9 family P-type conjugative transfer protein [Paraburkholderia aromaticivorans]
MISLTRIAAPIVAALGMSLIFATMSANAAVTEKHGDIDPVAASDGASVNPAGQFNGGVDPVTMPNDARMAVFTYSRDQIFRVMTAPLKTTTIEFAGTEKLIADPAMGDTIRWTIDTDGANHVFVKPNQPGLINTLHLSTNLREYDITLVSSPLGGLFYQTVRFNYPESLMAKVREHQQASSQTDASADATNSGALNVSPDKLNFNWDVHGDAAFRPETVFDDGKFIWMRMPANAPYAVPIIKDHGDNVSPNFSRRGPYLVVQQMADEIVLRANHDEVKVNRRHNGLFGL